MDHPASIDGDYIPTSHGQLYTAGTVFVTGPGLHIGELSVIVTSLNESLTGIKSVAFDGTSL